MTVVRHRLSREPLEGQVGEVPCPFLCLRASPFSYINFSISLRSTFLVLTLTQGHWKVSPDRRVNETVVFGARTWGRNGIRSTRGTEKFWNRRGRYFTSVIMGKMFRSHTKFTLLSSLFAKHFTFFKKFVFCRYVSGKGFQDENTSVTRHYDPRFVLETVSGTGGSPSEDTSPSIRCHVVSENPQLPSCPSLLKYLLQSNPPSPSSYPKIHSLLY